MTSLRSKILTSYGLSKAALLIFVAVVIADLHYLQTHIVEGVAVEDLSVASQEIRRDEKNLFLYHTRNHLDQLRLQLDVARTALREGERVFAAIAGPQELAQLDQVLDSYSALLDEYAGLPLEDRAAKQDEIRAAGHRLSTLTQDVHQRQRAILDGMVLVDFQVAFAFQFQPKAAVRGELVQHVVKKADAGGHLAGSGRIEVDKHPYVGLAGLTLDPGLARAVEQAVRDAFPGFRPGLQAKAADAHVFGQFAGGCSLIAQVHLDLDGLVH